MEFSGRVEVIVELDGQITDEWQAAWRDYDWSADPDAAEGFQPELRVGDQGTTVSFELGLHSGVEEDLSALITGLEACNDRLEAGRSDVADQSEGTGGG
jgi:hypothetical protein